MTESTISERLAAAVEAARKAIESAANALAVVTTAQREFPDTATKGLFLAGEWKKAFTAFDAAITRYGNLRELQGRNRYAIHLSDRQWHLLEAEIEAALKDAHSGR